MKKRKLFNGSFVEVGDMPINVAIRKLKQKLDDSGKLEDVKENMFYEKPTTRRKRKKGAAKARLRKQLRDQSLPPKLY
jgi:small subunit ribosomal protein S21